MFAEAGNPLPAGWSDPCDNPGVLHPERCASGRLTRGTKLLSELVIIERAALERANNCCVETPPAHHGLLWASTDSARPEQSPVEVMIMVSSQGQRTSSSKAGTKGTGSCVARVSTAGRRGASLHVDRGNGERSNTRVHRHAVCLCLREWGRAARRTSAVSLSGAGGRQAHR